MKTWHASTCDVETLEGVGGGHAFRYTVHGSATDVPLEASANCGRTTRVHILNFSFRLMSGESTAAHLGFSYVIESASSLTGTAPLTHFDSIYCTLDFGSGVPCRMRSGA